ncbi:MAG: hypothetical protein JKP98_03815 [Rhodobacteraceae bacterium]|nr:hypothetical protein [Paracoccaceae bacterium]
MGDRPGRAAEDQGFVGQRHDWHAGLIYLNARYMDPELGRFIQPDWLDPNQPGVGRTGMPMPTTIRSI